MSQKEANRLHVMKLLKNKLITQRKASELMNLSKSQTIRIKKAYLKFGIAGLISKRRGKPSPNKIPDKIKKEASLIIGENYHDFGPTLTNEKLSKNHNIKMSIETVRKLMIQEGFWKGKKHKKVIAHQMRSRRSRFGELIQIDGSPHKWFEDRAEECCLIVFIDDATSKVTAAKLCDVETKIAYLNTLKEHIDRYGKPLAFYSDKHQIFKVNNKKNPTSQDLTHFAKVLKELNIDLICANTPQAKGRVERANRILQDRLIKEMRLKNVSSIEEGNAFLKEYLQEHNEKFSKRPSCSEDAHRPLKEDLNKVFAYKKQRKLSKNLTFQYEGILYQIDPQIASFGMKHSAITVIDKQGDIKIEYKGKKLTYKKHADVDTQAIVLDRKAINSWLNKKSKKPSKHHPWR